MTAEVEQGYTVVTRKAPTLSDLLEEGQQILARREQEEARRREGEQRRRQESWDALRQKVASLCPELACAAPPAPPDDFPGDQRRDYSAEFRLWDAASIFVAMAPARNGWELTDRIPPFRVSTTFRAKKEDGRWAPVPDSWRETDSLAEALALCHRASFGPYRDCAEKCKALAAEEFKAKAAPLPPAPPPPTALERLGLALHDYFAECLEGQE